ncbi:Putative 1,2-dihydroxy-3-keto-5-methylthiopentene dioxygenase [Rhizopus microsporus]|nr:Putative 1,2-dihydroxy-3-keto-5-methylthiopentene dioxygenase [Rhizopus microsporus]
MKLYLFILLNLIPLALTMRAYVYDDKSNADQRAPHDTGIKKTQDDLAKIGILYWRIDGPDSLDRLDEIAKRRDYKHRDTVEVSPSAFGSLYEEKLKQFFSEHLHEDEEIRYILDGSGYFDVRDEEDVWIRIAMEKGDMIILPPGIYHRFTTDENDFIQALRLFKDDPVWTPINRPLADDNKYRVEYLKTYNITA